jgi:hypothetical protein
MKTTVVTIILTDVPRRDRASASARSWGMPPDGEPGAMTDGEAFKGDS